MRTLKYQDNSEISHSRTTDSLMTDKRTGTETGDKDRGGHLLYYHVYQWLASAIQYRLDVFAHRPAAEAAVVLAACGRKKR